MNTLLLEHLAAVSKVAAARQSRERQQGVDCSQGYLRSTDAGPMFKGPRTLEVFFNYQRSTAYQRPAGFTADTLELEIPASDDTLVFYCGRRRVQASIVDGQDYHAYISYDGDTATAYLNGVVVGTITPVNYLVPPAFIISDATYPLKGPVYFARIYNYALSTDEVAALYNNGDPAGYVLPIPYKYKVANYISDFSKNTDGWSTVANYPGISLNGGDGILSIYGDSTTLAIQKQNLSSGDKPSIFRIRIVFVEPFQGSRIRFYAHSFNDYADLTLSSEKLNAEGVVHIKKASNTVPSSFMYLYDVSIGDVVKISTITIESVGCLAEYLPQNIAVPHKYDYHNVEFPIGSYTPSHWVWATTNIQITAQTYDIPQANGFSGDYMRFEAVSKIVRVYNNYRGQQVLGSPLRITFEYRSSGDLYIDQAVSGIKIAEANDGSPKTISIVIGATPSAIIYLPNATGAWLEIRTLSIEAVDYIIKEWLDSAKQLPLNDEYLPPLLETAGGFDLTANGTTEIVYKPE